MTANTIASWLDDLPSDFAIGNAQEMPLPRSVLMCPPDYFDVIDIKNQFMRGRIGSVNHADALRQWHALKDSYESAGIKVEVIDALPGCEDMVFCANPVFVGLDEGGRRVCVTSSMKYPSRQREVIPLANWFKNKDYMVASLDGLDASFEGGGDAIWHPGRRLIWGGYGHRSEPEVYPALAQRLGTPVITLELADARFYHLDTCFCPLSDKAVMLYPPALTETGMALIRRVFEYVIEVRKDEAINLLACNAASFLNEYVFIQRGAIDTNRQLSDLGFKVVEVETDEFLKSGGSVSCMKAALF
jgi:N-dimethylarginine dimethylaminohydrolase